MKNRPTSIVFLFLTAAIWGFAFVAQVAGGEYLGTFYFNGIRFVLGGLILIPLIMVFERESREKNKITVLAGIAAGIILFIAANLQQWGINITGSAGKGGFLTAMYSVFVPVLASVFLRKKTGRNSWLGAVISLVGLFLILSGNMASKDPAIFRITAETAHNKGVFTIGFGDVVLLMCALAFAVHVVFIDYFNSSISPIKFSSAQFLTAGTLSLIVAYFTETITVSAVTGAVIPILYAGIMSTGVAYTLQVIGQRGVHPTVSAIILSTESMFAAIGGAVIAGERMTVAAYIGCAVMMLGIIIAQIPSRSGR